MFVAPPQPFLADEAAEHDDEAPPPSSTLPEPDDASHCKPFVKEAAVVVGEASVLGSHTAALAQHKPNTSRPDADERVGATPSLKRKDADSAATATCSAGKVTSLRAPLLAPSMESIDVVMIKPGHASLSRLVY